MARVARGALEICHFDPESGEDISEGQGIACEAACYDCLLEYGNQIDHNFIDRKLVKDLLMTLAGSETEASSSGVSRVDHLDELMRRCDTELERKWLQLVHDTKRTLPTDAQHQLSDCYTRPDFYYADKKTAIYIDGPVHEQDAVAEKDEGVEARLFSAGIVSIRFHHDEDWEAKLDQYKDIFGSEDK